MIVARRRARRRLVAACLGGLVLASALAACGSTKGAGSSADPSNASATTTIKDAVDPSHAVAAPGKWDGKLPGDDLLVVGDKTLPGDLVKRIKAIKVGTGKKAVPGVAVSAALSYGQFAIQNQYYNIAAVDPSTYRDFTGLESAKWQEQWDRIAGGEMAVMKHLENTIPLDSKGYLAVGSGAQTERIHVGAWSPATVDAVDAMVNTRWGQALGLPADNAMLINTGFSSPAKVRQAIRRIDPKLSVVALDIVAQTGIDPGTFSTVIPVGTLSQAIGVYHYTPIGGGAVRPDPAWVQAHIRTEVMPIIGPMTCNKYIFPQLQAALIEIQKEGLASKITNYAGCYNPRFIAGTTTLSNHAFGLAFDIDPSQNERGTVGHMDPGVIAVFEHWGFTWGGTWTYTDPMHFELNHIVKPG
ncbi:MAG: M15 family metallopeptidase [Nocardioidaceae bacterium]|nr:M15 family metallopeptidase [Nocardioidaceae bacterium]MCL2614705.1 M15 family metallopeptidase [Nocardioidaceae bacterium]